MAATISLDFEMLKRVAHQARFRQDAEDSGRTYISHADMDAAKRIALAIVKDDKINGSVLLLITLNVDTVTPPLRKWRTEYLEYRARVGPNPIFPEKAFLDSPLATKAVNPMRAIRERAVKTCIGLAMTHSDDDFIAAFGNSDWYDELHADGQTREVYRKGADLAMVDAMRELRHPVSWTLGEFCMQETMVDLNPDIISWRLRALYSLVKTNCAPDCVREESPRMVVLCTKPIIMHYIPTTTTTTID